jgi:hypothetical protein
MAQSNSFKMDFANKIDRIYEQLNKKGVYE